MRTPGRCVAKVVPAFVQWRHEQPCMACLLTLRRLYIPEDMQVQMLYLLMCFICSCPAETKQGWPKTPKTSPKIACRILITQQGLTCPYMPMHILLQMWACVVSQVQSCSTDFMCQPSGSLLVYHNITSCDCALIQMQIVPGCAW